MPGKKTHEQQLRILERKPGVPEQAEIEEALKHLGEVIPIKKLRKGVRESEFPVSRGGFHQETRGHNKREPTQGHHKPQKHSPAEEKK